MTQEMEHQVVTDGFVLSRSPFNDALIEQLSSESHEHIRVVTDALD